MRIMNQYFSLVIFGPYIELVKSLVLGFKGILVFHPFGVESGMTYTRIFQEMGGNWLMLAIEKLGKRFWFGQSYDNLKEIECDYFVNHSIDLPIGMIDTTVDSKWNGNKKKILFICPRVKINAYYEMVYKKFKEDFEGIPYAIGGVQPIMNENNHDFLGYLPQDEYDSLYYDYSVMFYHSREPHHVHYHPFEAVKKGMPLIFMSEGLLDHLGGKNLPGRATSIKEARKKCKRIINGDKKFIDAVRSSQQILLEPMKYENCKKAWINSFEKIERESVVISQYKEIELKRIAIILPLGYTGGVLDYTIRIVKALKRGIEQNNSKIELVLGHLDDKVYGKEDYFKDLRNMGISIRKFKWEKFSSERLRTTLALKGYSYDFIEKEYILPNDGINYFGDCDFLLFMSDHVPGHTMILKPYGVILHDYIQRYIPEIMENFQEREFFNFARAAVCCYTTTENTRQDAINYAGVSSDKIRMLPLFFETINATEENDGAEAYFLWSTNISIHKNHKIALEAIERYYTNGGTLKCFITGTNTNKLMEGDSENEYVNEVRDIINHSPLLRNNIKILGYMKKEKYIGILKNAQFLFHPGYADNGNGTAFDAAMLGVPCLSSDYEAMRNMNRVCDLSILFFRYDDVEEISAALYFAEKNQNIMKRQLPCREILKKHTIQDSILCNKIYENLLSYLGVM